ncbi:hypothetical protein CALCODRAFT_501376 [Calocera cornea HHB12733]|uniref:Uncharacterized protein n=1 Tax=Calocera cornea HHB12733 TaxID=1353952 RepID=A0A165DN94_9BASI|nr:hypothetical protein CALCODRAFT_501376 [Calocera cornea HHB12733]
MNPFSKPLDDELDTREEVDVEEKEQAAGSPPSTPHRTPEGLQSFKVQHPNLSIFHSRKQSASTTDPDAVPAGTEHDQPEVDNDNNDTDAHDTDVSQIMNTSSILPPTPHPPGQFYSSRKSPNTASPPKKSMSLLRSLSLSPKKKGKEVPTDGQSKANIPLPSPIASTPGNATPAKKLDFGSAGSGKSSETEVGFESPAADRASRLVNQTFNKSRSFMQSQSTTPESSPPANLTSRILSTPGTPGPSAAPLPPRSILRPPQTPGTGQSVRFNGREAFRIISPNRSGSSSSNVSLSLALLPDETSGSLTLDRMEDMSVDRLLSMREESLDTVELTGTGFEREGTPVGAVAIGMSPEYRSPAVAFSTPVSTSSSRSGTLPPPRLTPLTAPLFDQTQDRSISLQDLEPDFTNLNSLDLSGALRGGALDSRDSSGEYVPPFASVSPHAVSQSPKIVVSEVPDAYIEEEEEGEGGANETAYLSTFESPSVERSLARIARENHNSVQSYSQLRLPEGQSLVVTNPDIDASRALSKTSSSPVAGPPTPSTGLSRNGSPISSTPDVTAYLSVAEWSGELPSPGGSAQESPLLKRTASQQALGLGKKPSLTSMRSENTSIISRINVAETVEEAAPWGAGRVFSRAAQPMDGIIAAVSDPMERTLPSPEKQQVSVYNVTVDQSVVFPGKFRWDRISPPSTPSPAPARGTRNPSGSSNSSSTAISSLELHGVQEQVFSAHEDILQHVREQNSLFFQFQEGQQEREIIKQTCGELAADLRLLVESDTVSLRSSLFGPGGNEEHLRREMDELKSALSVAEKRAREELAKRTLLEQDKQEIQLRAEQQRQRLEYELAEVREVVEEMKEARLSQVNEMDELHRRLESKAREIGESTAMKVVADIVQGKDEEIEALRGELEALQEIRDSTPTNTPLIGAPSDHDQQDQLEANNKLVMALQREVGDYERQLRDLTNALTTANQKVTMLDSEVKAQWESSERASDRIQQLEKDKKAILSDLQKFQGERHEREVQMKEQAHELAAKLSEAWTSKGKIENEKDDLAKTLADTQQELEVARTELAQFQEQFEAEQQEHHRVRHAFEELQDESQAVFQEREEATEAKERLESLVREQDNDLASTTMRIMEGEKEIDTLRGEMAQLKRDYERQLASQARKIDEAMHRAEEAEQAKNEMIRRTAMEDVNNDGWKSKVQVLKDENDKMRKEVHDLQMHMRDKELEVERLKKSRQDIKDDKDGLNLALEAKQQELDLLKRKYGVKGVAGGNTPATNRAIRPASRESLPFSTPASRAPSREARERRTTLGTVDPLRSSAFKAPSTIEASKLSRRSSILATPTPATVLAKSQTTGTKPSLAGSSRRPSMPTTLQRRVSSGGMPPRAGPPSSIRAPSVTLQSVEDKENEDPIEEDVIPEKVNRRRTMLAA